MSMDFRLSLEQKQVISQQMMQKLSILQLGIQDLDEYIENLSVENPVVDLVQTVENPVETEDQRQALLHQKMEWLEATDRQNRTYYSDAMTDTDLYDRLYERQSGTSLTDYLSLQLLCEADSPADGRILTWLIHSLDSKGYFSEDLSAAAASLGTSEQHVLRLLRKLQACDPAGVGARNLQECLLIQLERMPERDKVAEGLVRDHLDMLAQHHLRSLAGKMHCSEAEIMRAYRKILELDPKPGACFYTGEQTYYIRPDALVIRDGSSYMILANRYGRYSFSVSNYYRMLERTTRDPETKQYLQQKIRQAETALQDIENRATTLEKVLEVLVDRQRDFFDNGPGHRVPLRLVDIAELLMVHESTVSRVLKDKYLQCAWGIFPLSYFLTSVAARSPDGTEQTPERIKGLLQGMIDGEDKKKPYSDTALQVMLKEYEIYISRRTVSKYRQEMGIPDKTGRRVYD